MLIHECGKQLFSYLFEHRRPHLADITVTLPSDSGNSCGAEQSDSAQEQQLFMIFIQIIENLSQVLLCHKLVYVIGTVKNSVEKFAPAYLLFQYIIQIIREKEIIGR